MDKLNELQLAAARAYYHAQEQAPVDLSTKDNAWVRAGCDGDFVLATILAAAAANNSNLRSFRKDMLVIAEMFLDTMYYLDE